MRTTHGRGQVHMDMERRLATRIQLGCQGVLFLPEEEIPVTIQDVSRGGILFNTNKMGFCIGDKFKFQFVDEDYNVVTGIASLVRINKDCDKSKLEIGCKCSAFDPRGYIDKLEIKHAVSCIMKKPALAV